MLQGKEHDFWTGLEGIASTDSGKVEATGQVHLALELLSPSSPEWASFDSLQGGMVGTHLPCIAMISIFTPLPRYGSTANITTLERCAVQRC